MSDSTTPFPTFNQGQREALFDFLLLAAYADNSLKLSENQRLYELISGLGWESYQDPTEYADTATARVRAASESEAATQAFLTKLNDPLATPEAKVFAIGVLPRILESDNSMPEAEEAFYAAAKAAFGV
jgi:Tellurite resistance protein TerB